VTSYTTERKAHCDWPRTSPLPISVCTFEICGRDVESCSRLIHCYVQVVFCDQKYTHLWAVFFDVGGPLFPMSSSWSGSPACLYSHCETKVGLQPFFLYHFLVYVQFSLIPSLQLVFYFLSETPGMDFQCRHLEPMLFMISVGRWHTGDPVLSAVCDVMFKGTVCRHCHKSADLTVCDKWRDIHKACNCEIDRLMDRQPVLLCTLCSFKTLNASFCKANYLLHSDDTVYVQIALCDSDWPNHKSLLKNHTLGVLMKKCLVTCVKNICQILLIDFDGFSAVRPWRKRSVDGVSM